MKGLFVKDLKLMMLQKNFLLLILAIVIGMMIFTDDVIFPLGFLSFIVSLFTVSTISYDDFDNGNAFLFTLPITRNHYVSEKYFLGLLLGCMAWVLATVLGIITTVLKDTLPITDLVQSSLMILPIMIVVQAIMLPFQLKFGGDKGRIAMIGAFGGLAVITLVIVKGAEAIFNIDLVSLAFFTSLHLKHYYRICVNLIYSFPRCRTYQIKINVQCIISCVYIIYLN